MRDTAVLVLIICLMSEVLADLSGSLHHYELLHHKQLTHRIVKRSTTSPHPLEQQVDLKVHGRELKLHLQQKRSLFTEDFKAFSVNASGSEDTFHVDQECFYEGFVVGNEQRSEVHAYYDDKDLVAQIILEDEVIIIEPSRGHLPVSDNYSMISYKMSDMKLDAMQHPENHMGTSYCGYVHPERDDAAYRKPEETVTLKSKYTGNRRHKRAVPTKNTCPLMLVADYRLFQGAGQGEKRKTADYLIGQMERVDALYRRHNFSSFSQVGFEIKGIIIHTEPTIVTDGTEHYNMRRETWEPTPLLRAFSSHNWEDYCLAHLFTQLAFSDGVLGLGWIASPQAGVVGGMCSKESGGKYYNTAWTSALNKNNQRILTQEAELVTAHEFGHNWGSQHDPETAECAPSTRSGGKYVMYTYSVSGYERNNKFFSPCSTRSMGAVLSSKSSFCFTERSSSFCGNYHVEEGEDCDSGGQEDQCCTKQCKFKSGAVCSDANSLCCENCALAAATKPCLIADPNSLLCEGGANCTGTSPDCPAPAPKTDGSPCFDNGTCSAGECQPFCEGHDLVTCMCDEVENSCLFCCQDPKKNGTCEPYGTTPDYYLKDAKPCVIGYCETGVCKQQVTDLTGRLWNIIQNLSVDAIIQWMKDNIVLAVIFFSLVLYIPICIIIACVDWRKEKKEEEEREWHSKKNDVLTRGDGRQVQKAFLARRRPKKAENVEPSTSNT